ncbi:MAG: baseplate J/gp47 family protein [Streptosporangiaceae bacterium]
MADQNEFGVTASGFVLKGVDRIVADQQARAQAMFGADADLTSGSALRKVLDAVAWDAQELWLGLEAQYYANFVTTATGPSLDLLGTDLGIARQNLQALGQVVLTLTNGAPARSYVLPEGTVVETAALPAISFRTTDPVTLSPAQPTATVGVQAVDRGPAGNLPAAAQLQLDPGWVTLYLNLGGATVTPTNPQGFSGGELAEADADYRSRLLGVPRTIWTVDALLAQVLGVNGVRDAAIFDPLGGVDVSQGYFNMFLFGQRAFSLQRQLGSPYYFDIVVAAEPSWPWTTDGGNIPGLYDTLLDTVQQWRPASIFPNIIQANEVDIGMRATLVIQAGHDQDAIKGQIVSSLQATVDNLPLGRGVLYSDVMLIARTAPGVVDVQNLHLRRNPPAFASINFSGALFGQSVELDIGQNVVLAPDEIAQFSIDSSLIDIGLASQ